MSNWNSVKHKWSIDIPPVNGGKLLDTDAVDVVSYTSDQASEKLVEATTVRHVWLDYMFKDVWAL